MDVENTKCDFVLFPVIMLGLFCSFQVILRSTPCPTAKSGDEWLEPEQCENGDDCGYCHTRTEQQFHPEIYKSTKCNDMLDHGYCPRAVFCAFAHHDSELHVQRAPYYRPSSNSEASVLPKQSSSSTSSANAEPAASPTTRPGSVGLFAVL